MMRIHTLAFCLATLPMSIMCDATLNTTRTFGFRVMTYNVCHPTEIQKNQRLYKKFAWSSRKDEIFKQILEKEKPDIIGFQEIRDEKNGSSVADLWEGLGKYGYEIISFKNNPSDLSLINTIAYRKNKFFLDSINRWWVSNTPDRFSDSWGNGWGRVTLMATLYPISTKKMGTQDFSYPNYEFGPIHIVNVHNGLKHIEKMHANDILVKQIEALVAHSKGIVVVTGDFNCFPDDGGIQELQVLKDSGYQEALNDLITSEGVHVSGTFIGYSYDRFRSPRESFGTQLDHIWVKSLSPTNFVASSSHISLARRDGRKITAKTEKELLVGPGDIDMHDAYCSDHAAGVVDFKISFGIE